MNIDYWVSILKQDSEAIRSFLTYLQSHISESSKQFKTASSMEQVSKIQGRLEILDLIQKDFNREQLKEQENATYESRFRKSPTGT